MPLDFPNSPNVNDTFTSNGRSWKWNGTTWDLVPIAHTHPMADLVDFAVSTPATGQALVYNGTKWANSSTYTTQIATKLTAVAAAIPTAANLNDYVYPGFYHQSLNVFASAGVNYPVPFAGMLTVTAPDGGGMVYQIYQVYRDFPQVFFRTRYDNSWTAWFSWSRSLTVDVSGSISLDNTYAGKTVRSTGGAITVTVTNTLYPGDRIDFIQDGTGQITFAASGVTLQSKGAKLKTSAQYAGATIFCVAAGQYRLIGDLA